MDKTNILTIFDELSATMPNCKISINFSSNKKPEIDEPSVLITLLNPKNISVNYYMTAEESQAITKDELESALLTLLTQEQYRRKIIFRNATISNSPWE